MDKKELQEARTNPDFLNHLEQTRLEAIKNEDIQALYEVMDSMLILDLDEEKINEAYQTILKIAFEKIEDILNNNQKLSLQNEELLYVRSFYEHAIEKWSYTDFKGAKEFFFVLINIVEDSKLIDALKVHLIACAKEFDLDNFYENYVELDMMDIDEKYGYFIINFKFDTHEYINENLPLIKGEFAHLQHLLDN